MIIDPFELSKELINCRSVTPEDGGSQDVLQKALEILGLECEQVVFSEKDTPSVGNLYARLGNSRPNFCFAGHTDVVPEGNLAEWKSNPFEAEIRDGVLFGRGAADMKTAIACFVAALSRFLEKWGLEFGGSISILITGDEEGPAVNGTKKLLKWVKKKGVVFDDCLVGEPTNPNQLGEMIKIGRRGSLNGYLTILGTQGHTAYPDLAENPIHLIAKIVERITTEELDQGTDHFQPSTVQFSTVDVNNPATNVIPSKAMATFNIRFNDLHTSKQIEAWLRRIIEATSGVTKTNYDLKITVTGEAFLTEPGRLSQILTSAIKSETNLVPELSTSGGTSDARFIKEYCPVAEFGMVGKTMHKINEAVDLADLEALNNIYFATLETYFDKK